MEKKGNTDRHISPLGLMCLQGEEMKKETKIDVKNRRRISIP